MKFPYWIVQSESTHVAFALQTWHDDPHALSSCVVSMQEPPQRVKPGMHAKSHPVSEHLGVAFAGVVHAEQVPAQQMPAPQGCSSGTLPVAVQVAWPLLQDIVPVLHALPSGEQSLPPTHATQAPAKHTCPWPHEVPSATSPTATQVADPPAQEVTPV